jgi:hypothetical protein
LDFRPASCLWKNASAKKAQVRKDRTDCNRRPRHAKRTKDIIGIGTWNVQTLLKPGKMQEIADQIKNSQIKILALQEISGKDTGK